MFEFESKEVTFEKMEDGKYKIIAMINIYKDDKSIIPLYHQPIEFRLPLTDKQFVALNKHKVFTFKTENDGKGTESVTIHCDDN